MYSSFKRKRIAVKKAHNNSKITLKSSNKKLRLCTKQNLTFVIICNQLVTCREK